VYTLSAAVREAIDRTGSATLLIDLHPDLTQAEVATRLERRRPKDSLSTALKRTLGLSPTAVALLREVCGNALPGDTAALAALLKAVPVVVGATASIDRAISSAGGIAFDEIDESFMLRRLPGVFVAGEMLDWEAPTGGYLLTACFATGVQAGKGAARWWKDLSPEQGVAVPVPGVAPGSALPRTPS
jgi:predicted flavoprotein YhiN